MQKRLLTIAAATVTGSLALGSQAVANEHENGNSQDKGQNQQPSAQQAQGLYATEDIIGSDVYHVDNTDEDVGDVENILLDDEGKISALVLSTGGLWGIGGDEVVVGIEHFSMETERDESAGFGQGAIIHRIMVDATEEELENFPSYNEGWFDDERNRLIEQRGISGGIWQTTGGGDGREPRDGKTEADIGNKSAE